MNAKRISVSALTAWGCLVVLGGLLSAADDPKTAEEAKALIDKGGKHWSSPKKVKSGKDTFAAGSRFFIWPVEDKVFESRRGVPSVTVKLGWRLQAGQKALMKKEFLVCWIRPEPFDGTTRVEQAALKVGEESGTFSAAIPLGKLKAGEEREALYLLSLNRKPVSNLLRLKVKAGK